MPRKRAVKKRGGKQVAKAQETTINRLEKEQSFNADHDECVRLVEERGREQIVSLEPPKKSLTAYTLFVKVKRRQILDENPDAKTPQIMKEIGRMWNVLSEGEKTDYKRVADNGKHLTLIYRQGEVC